LAVQHYGDDLREAVTRAHRINREIKANTSALAAGIYQVSTLLPKGDARVERFFETLETGIGVTRSDPVWLLRRLLIRARTDRRRYTVWESLAFLLKAWNHTAKKTPNLTTITWRANESFPSPFLPPPIVDAAPVVEDES
jgi:hypothetical protein